MGTSWETLQFGGMAHLYEVYLIDDVILEYKAISIVIKIPKSWKKVIFILPILMIYKPTDSQKTKNVPSIQEWKFQMFLKYTVGLHIELSIFI